MRSIKPIPLALVIGAFTLGACSDRLGSTSTTDSAVSAHASEPGGGGASGVHISHATVQQINELLRLYGIPVVLSTGAKIAQPAQHGAAECFASERGTLIISLSAGG